MSKVIIYSQGNGRVAVIYPTAYALEKYGIDAIAQKDVPSGKPYKIIDASEVPTDRKLRDAWTVRTDLLSDGIGADSNVFPERGEE